MQENKKQELDLVVLGKVLKLSKPYKSIFVFCLILAVIMAIVANIGPFLIGTMTDEYILKNDMDGLIKMSYIYIAVVVVNVIVRYLFIYYSQVLGQSVIKDLRVKVFNHISSLRLKYFDTTPIGTSTTRTINDIETINTVFSQGAITIIADLLTVFVVLAVMFSTSVQLTLICLTTMPFLIVATYIFKEKVKASFQRVRNEISTLNSFLQEQISGMQVVQMFNAEKQEAKKFKAINKRYTSANLDAIEYYAIFFPVVELISAIGLALLIWWGSNGIWNSTISAGAFISFPLYLNKLFRPVRMLADKFNTLQMGLVAADRVFKLLENDDHILDSGTQELTSAKGKVEFQNVSFAYDEKNFVLNDISFQITAGETLAIVGSTGSGKTSIINVLNRFYEIQSGKVLIDDTDVKKIKLKSLRSKIAMVLQDVFLFNGTVIDNITLRDTAISREEVISASKIIGAHPFIESMPGGYDFKVTERGSNLSMGQRQLISFVRALVINPNILILDEATSSIDTETETIIQYAIEKLIEKRTSIIIAHRLSTIRHANKILVLHKGEIVEIGSHDELIQNKDGQYRKLYEKQFEQTASV